MALLTMDPPGAGIRPLQLRGAAPAAACQIDGWGSLTGAGGLGDGGICARGGLGDILIWGNPCHVEGGTLVVTVRGFGDGGLRRPRR